ncbi:molybdenum cofactor synthesis domain-containing protein [Natroniella sp. ANB-PHB2]|uniref:molybdenum cofactor synthesis domain-containing protein n=1 Tax=Natroniella sp. ANB-PHB2 TaxID=3384444 RepID=UPI0038D40FC7
MGRNIYLDNLPLDQAIEKWYSKLNLKAKIEQIDVREALGRKLARKVVAQTSSPHYPASAMDGIAVKSQLTAGASERNPIKLTQGEGYQLVDTGDPLPEEFDAVVMIEDVNIVDGLAQIERPAASGQHVRKVGESLIAGQLILGEGEEITPHAMGLILEGNVKRVEVYVQPKVKIIPTGTELVTDKEKLEPGDIIEFNSHVLSGLAKNWGAEPKRGNIVADNYEKIRKKVIEAVAISDFVVITAGSSAGREDYTADIIEELGEVIVHGVSIRPGGPTVLGVIADTPVMGVPGYPVASALAFRLFARELIYRLAGQKLPSSKKIKAKLSKKIVSDLGYKEFVRVKLAQFGEELIATPLARSAGVLGSLVAADGLLVSSEYSEGLESGQEVKVELLTAKLEADKSLLVAGSRDLALDLLKNRLKKEGVGLTFQHLGSRGALTALRRNEVQLAAIHFPVEGDYSKIKKFLGDKEVVGVNLGFCNKKISKEAKRKGINSLAPTDLLNAVEEGQIELGLKLIIPKAYLEEPRIKKLLELIESEEFKAEMQEVGYQISDGLDLDSNG